MGERARQVIVTADGPVLVSGPVEVTLPDGTRVRSNRPVTALCVCRRSKHQPFCDTSHRPRVRGCPATDDDPEEDRAQQDRASTQ